MAKDAMPGDEVTEAPPEEGRHAPDEGREGDGQDYIDRDKIDFDPDDGLLSGTALDGTSDIPGSNAAADQTEQPSRRPQPPSAAT